MKHAITAVLMANLLAITSVWASEPAFPHLETVGVGEVVAIPDMAEISVKVDVTEPTASEAKKLSDKAVTRFILQLEKIGIAQRDIQSANINLQPRYKYQQGRAAELTGYNATRILQVTVHNLSLLNGILDSALNNGINRIDNIVFKASNMSELQIAARNAAIKDAQTKAKALAKGFNEKLSGIWEIRYFEQQPVTPVLYATRAMADSVEKGYQNAQITVSDRVEVIYKLAH